MTEQTEPNTNPGWRWFLLYVLVITVFLTVTEAARAVALQNISGNTIMIQVTSIAGLLLYVVQGFVLPRPISRQRVLWIVLSLAAAIVASLVSGYIIRILVFRVSNEAMTLRALAVYNTLSSILLFTVAVGTAQFFVLRRYVRYAWLWYIALLLSSTAGLPASFMRNALLTADLESSIRQASLVLFAGGAALTSAVMTGVVLWLLVARFQKDNPATKDPGFRHNE